MSPKPDRNQNEDMRPEYDLRGFHDSTTVNEALRLLIRLAEKKAVASTKRRAPDRLRIPVARKPRQNSGSSGEFVGNWLPQRWG